MKKLIGIITLIMAISAGSGWAQESNKERKEKRRMEKQAILEQNLDVFNEWIESKEFIILTNSITGRYGGTYNLQPNVNFIKVEGDEIIIQTSQPHLIGSNGLGGLTTKGIITSMETTTDEQDKPISFMINYSTPALGIGSITFHVNGTGNASAYLRGNWGLMATFRGEFANPDSTNTYTGTQRF